MRRTVALLVVALLLGGCWADEDDEPTTADDPPAEQDDPTEPDPTEPGAPWDPTIAGPPPTFADHGPNIAPEGAPTADDLEDVMPPSDVLGDRFEMDFSELYDMDDTNLAKPFCANGWPGNHLSELHEPADVGGIDASYAYGSEPDSESEGPIVVVSAASFPDAAGHVRDAAAQIEACAAAEPDDVPAGTYVVDGDPGLGDVSFAYRLVGELPMGSFTLTSTQYLTLVAVGDVVVLVRAAESSDIPQAPPSDDLDLAALESFVEQVVEGVAGLR